MGHVVSVTYPGDLQVLQTALLILYGHKVAKDLTGMIEICQSVYDRYIGPSGHLLNHFLGIGPYCQYVDIAGEHARRILDRLIPGHLGVSHT